MQTGIKKTKSLNDKKLSRGYKQVFLKSFFAIAKNQIENIDWCELNTAAAIM